MGVNEEYPITNVKSWKDLGCHIDIADIRDLLESAYRKSLKPDYFDLEPDGIGLMNNSESYIGIYVIMHLDAFSYLDKLVVHPRYQKNGMGEALLRDVEALSKAAGKRGVVLRADAKNEDAQRFYIREGFRRMTPDPVKSLFTDGGYVFMKFFDPHTNWNTNEDEIKAAIDYAIQHPESFYR